MPPAMSSTTVRISSAGGALTDLAGVSGVSGGAIGFDTGYMDLTRTDLVGRGVTTLRIERDLGRGAELPEPLAAHLQAILEGSAPSPLDVEVVAPRQRHVQIPRVVYRNCFVTSYLVLPVGGEHGIVRERFEFMASDAEITPTKVS